MCSVIYYLNHTDHPTLTHTHTHRHNHPPTKRSIFSTLYRLYIGIELHNVLGYFQTDRNKDKQRKWEKCRTTTNNKKRTAQTIKFDPRPVLGEEGVEGRGELKRWEKGDDKGISFCFENFHYENIRNVFRHQFEA